MHDDSILMLKGEEVLSLLTGRELDVIRTVRAAYEAHAKGWSSLPHSTFLRFPDNDRDRIIALPAYLGDDFKVAGVKWVSSFPGNVQLGIDRASAVVLLNSAETGRPIAILEGSVISAKRTAASAALAAQLLVGSKGADRLGLIGCGLINYEIARFILQVFPQIKAFTLYDNDAQRAGQFGDKCRKLSKEINIEIADGIEQVLRECLLVSFATTAIAPHLYDLSMCRSGATILHISLRDLSPEIILSADNVVDDIDHVCRAQTSIHLAEQITGNRDFVRCTLADVSLGAASARKNDEAVVIFSPFGLGVLDLAVSKLTCNLALEQGAGMQINSFLPESWLDRA
jgi:ornithine cyclodeaminase